MTCERCGGEHSRVIQTRHKNGKIFRDRQCSQCGLVFTTIEFVDSVKRLNTSEMRTKDMPVESYREYIDKYYELKT